MTTDQVRVTTSGCAGGTRTVFTRRGPDDAHADLLRVDCDYESGMLVVRVIDCDGHEVLTLETSPFSRRWLVTRTQSRDGEQRVSRIS